MKNPYAISFLALLCVLSASCQSKQTSVFKDALTFYTSFDQGLEAEFALGDQRIYSAPNRRALDSIQQGIDGIIHQIAKGEGQQGDALRFTKRNRRVVYYKSKNNIAYSPENWSGTISFWLKVDPETELEPGFTDPIQITDVSYNDAAIWVDFTRESPRKFRLGVIGDRKSWHEDTLTSSANEEIEKRLVNVDSPPFSNKHWTHVAITHKALGTDQATSSLYLDGRLAGTTSGTDDAFTWELENSNIYLGLSFVGLLDELSIFNTPFTPEQIQELFTLEGGIKAIL